LRRTEQELLDRMRRERLLQSDQPTSESADEFDPDALCAALDGGDALVEFGVLDDELFACVATRKGVQTFRRLARWQDVETAIGAVRFQIDALRYGAAAMAPHMERLQHRVEEHLRRIYECVWAPLEAALSGCLRLVIVPHAAMGALPFVALTDGKTCLGERHALSLAPSAQIATRLLGRPMPAPRTVLAVGDSKHLLHASREAQAVADLFENGEALIDDFATIDGLRLRCPGADVIHLACHAEFRRDNPMFSALHLNDGPLTAEFIEGLRLPNTIVVLSACETGLVGSYSGDELIGLVRGFMLAGASRVLASLWPVDDAVTVELMRHFYLALLAGQSPSQSLRQAQREVRTKHPHPFYWAPFVIQGGW
jgi:CHAT domain-containing protein